MAEFNSPLLGKVTKSVGNITMCYMNKKNIVKAKIIKRKKVTTPEVLSQQAKMKTLVMLAQQLLPVIRKGFAGVGKGSSSNAFTSMNMQAIIVDENYNATIDFEHLLQAFGILYTPDVSISLNAETRKYTFMQEKQENEDRFANENDQLYAALYEEKLQRAKIVHLKPRGESGSTSFDLPEEWDASKVHTYCFATTYNGRAASNSKYMTVETKA